MSNWLPDLSRHDGPKYRAIVDAIAADMAGGRLPPGIRLPTHRDLAWRLGVTVGTVARAYAEAERRGLLSGEVGRGTFVRAPGRDEPTLAHYLNEATWQPGDVVNLSVNRPDGDQGAWAVAPVLARLSQRPDLCNLLAYRFEALAVHHRVAGARWLATEGVAVAPEGVSVTAGTQQALLAALAVMTSPGDAVAVEEYTYPGIRSAVSLMGRTLVPVTMDADGIVPDDAERAFARGAKLLYTIATVHNPLTMTLAEDRRRALAEVARRHGAYVLEDGVHRFLDAAAPPPMTAFDPDHCAYLTTLSKSVSPGLRTAFMVAPPALRARFDATVGAMSLSLPTVLIEAAALMIEEGSAQEVAASRRREAVARCAMATEILGAAARSVVPSFNVWLELPTPWPSGAFVAEAARRGVRLGPTETFAIGRPAMDGVRVSVSCPAEREELRRGLTVLADILAAPPVLPGVTV